MTTKLPKIAIIITAYNAEKMILETLDSVKNQTFANWKCIIVDDNSKDDTVAIVKKYIALDHRFSLILNGKNLKQSKSINKALSKTSEDYVIILDSDDVLSENCLLNRIKLIEDSKDYDYYVFPNQYKFSNKLHKENKYSLDTEKKDVILERFLIHYLPTAWQVTGILFKRVTLLGIGGFNEKMMRIVDVELSTRLLLSDYRYKLFNVEPDYYYRVTGDENEVNEKRMRFYHASTVYITEILKFTKENNIQKLDYVKRYLSKFFIHVLAITIVSPQFNLNQTKEIIVFAFKNNLISKNTNSLLKKVFTLKLVYPIFKFPVIRNLIWHSLNFYVNKK